MYNHFLLTKTIYVRLPNSSTYILPSRNESLFKKVGKVGNRIINPPHKVSVHKMYWVSQLILEPWCVVMLNERFINTCGMVA